MLLDQDIIDSLFPAVNISRITLESSSDDKLISNLQFVLSDNIENSDISMWLNANKALAYLNVLVIQSADQEITNKILRRGFINNIGSIINSSANQASFGDQEATEVVRNELQEEGIGKFAVKIVSFREIFSNLQNAEDFIEIIDRDDGSKTVNVFVDKTFDQSLGFSENPQHLNYIFILYYDYSSFFSNIEIFDYNTPIRTNNGLIRGQETLNAVSIKNENVISNGIVNDKSYIFLTEDDKIWSGPTHENNQITNQQTGQTITTYRSGRVERPTSVDLRRIEIDNNKVLDLRDLKRLFEPEKLYEIIPENYIFETKLLSLEQKLLLENDSEFISDNFISTDFDGNTAITFFIDFKKLFIKKSQYGKLLSNSSSPIAKKMLDYFYSRASIESIALKNKRIDTDNSLYVEQDFQEINYVSGEFLNRANKKISFDTETPVEQLRCYSIVDPAPKNQGTYKYLIQIDYKDNVTETVYNTIFDLRQERLMLKEYYDIAILPGNFNKNINRFTAKFMSDLEEFNFNNLQNITFKLKEVLPLFFNITGFDLITLNLKTLMYLHPIIGTPDSISVILKLYDNVIDRLSKLVFSTPTVDNSLNEKGKGFQQQSNINSKSQIISLAKEFATIADFSSVYKLEYLNHLKSPTISNYSSTDFSYEVSKTDLISRKINISSLLTSQTTEEQQKNQVFDKLYKILGDYTNLEILPHNSYNLDNINLNVFESRNQVFPPALEMLANTFQNTEKLNLQNKIDLNRTLLTFLNPTLSSQAQYLQFIIDDASSPNMFWKINSTGFSAPTIVTNFFGQPTQSIIINNLFSNKTIAASIIKTIPNQLKQLIIFRTSANTSDKVINDGKIRIKYEMLKTVKSLKGFKYNEQSQTYSILEPIWDNLQLETAINRRFGQQPDRNVLQANNMLFCCLEDYNKNEIDYKFNSCLKEKTTNEFFFLNFSNINDSGKVINGATRISVSNYRSRCDKEVQDFFGDLTNIVINLDGKIINENDSIENNKYSFLSPIGVYFDKQYKLFESTSATATVEDILPTIEEQIQESELDITNIVVRERELQIIDSASSIRDASVSSTRNIIGSSGLDLTFFSNNSIRNIEADIGTNTISANTAVNQQITNARNRI